MQISPRGSVAFIITSLILSNASVTRAQSGGAYVSAGPMFVSGLGGRDFGLQVSAGAEKKYGPYGIGGGAGFVYFPELNETFDGGRGSATAPAYGVPSISLHETYYPGRARRGRRLQPFVTGNIFWMVAREAPPLPGLGGGVDWWTSRKHGLRCEAQYQFVWLSFRCGVVLR